jgi:DHA1 family bicyclomycin/chloramphenicol resistance-like MFS transporter
MGVGFIGGNQLNVTLLKRLSSEVLFTRALMLQTALGILLFVGTALGWYGLYSTLLVLFLFLACAGIIYPNAAALALEPFSKNTGSASALLGVLQLGIGAFISSGISLTESHNSLPIIAILATTSLTGLAIFIKGRDKARLLIAES